MKPFQYITILLFALAYVWMGCTITPNGPTIIIHDTIYIPKPIIVIHDTVRIKSKTNNIRNVETLIQQ